MGVDVHGFNFLRFAAARRPLGRTAMIGRQGVDTPPQVIQAAFPEHASERFDGYAESMLETLFGATQVDSFDNSAYEGATHIADFNRPVEIDGQYDTVMDFGTLEHVFDIRQALANCAALCAPGGRILHLLPANNQCGHGFWQFSPEVFFSLYSEANGCEDTRVFLADLSDERTWWEVRRPVDGVRVNVTSSGPLYVLAITRKTGRVRHEGVQQSDYAHVWSDEAGAAAPSQSTPHSIKTRRSAPPLIRGLQTWFKRLKPKNRMRASHPHLKRTSVEALVRETAAAG